VLAVFLVAWGVGLAFRIDLRDRSLPTQIVAAGARVMGLAGARAPGCSCATPGSAAASGWPRPSPDS
jgi:hypothetical protein